MAGQAHCVSLCFVSRDVFSRTTWPPRHRRLRFIVSDEELKNHKRVEAEGNATSRTKPITAELFRFYI